MSSRLRNLTAVARYWGDGEMKVYAAPIEDGRGGGTGVMEKLRYVMPIEEND